MITIIKKINKKKILLYIICLLPWFLSSILFKSDTTYYKSLTLPFIAPPSFVFPIAWTILYFLIAYSIYQVITYSTSNYKIYLLINYLSNQLFTYLFFTLKNNFLSLTDTIIVFISSLYLYVETNTLNQKASKYIIPYIIWNLYALILIGSIYFLNH